MTYEMKERLMCMINNKMSCLESRLLEECVRDVLCYKNTINANTVLGYKIKVPVPLVSC